MPADPVTVASPPHPMHAMTSSELSRYRRELESAVEFFGRKNPVPPACSRLQARLDEVLAEQESRRRIANPDRKGPVGL
jgi:hypothetical protein